MAFDLDGYVDVAERIRIFREKYPDGSLQPLNFDRPLWVEVVDGKSFVCYAAAAYRSPDDVRPGVGIAWEPFPGPTQFTRDSEAMNAETAAWGRAIVAALAADTQKIASAQEVRNRQGSDSSPGDAGGDRGTRPSSAPGRPASSDAATKPQRAKIDMLVNTTGWVPDPERWPGHWPLPDDLTKREASKIIDWIEAQPKDDPAERLATMRKGSDAAQREFIGDRS